MVVGMPRCGLVIQGVPWAVLSLRTTIVYSPAGTIPTATLPYTVGPQQVVSLRVVVLVGYFHERGQWKCVVKKGTKTCMLSGTRQLVLARRSRQCSYRLLRLACR